MPAPQGNYDQHGFPIPQRFDDQPLPPPRSNVDVRRRRLRWIFTPVLIAAICMLLWRSSLSDYGRQAMAEHYFQRGLQSHLENNDPQAIAYCDRGLEWDGQSPSAVKLLTLRLLLNKEQRQIEAAVDDITRLLELKRWVVPQRIPDLYSERAALYRRLGKQTESLADLDTAYELKPARSSMYANNRAYFRALFNVHLDEALADIQTAFEWDAEKPGQETNATYLDTRGFIYHRLGNDTAALADLNRAIKLTEDKAQAAAIDLKLPADEWPTNTQQTQHTLAIMYHHRGEIHAKLGNAREATRDLRRGDELGYDPQAGIE